MVEPRLINNPDYVFENDFMKIWIEDDILFGYYKLIDLFTLPMAKQVIVARKSLVKGKAYPILVDFTLVKNITKEAQAYFATKESTEGIVKAAFIVNSSLTRVLFNFFLLIYTPGPPARMFTSWEKAIIWLKKDA